MILLDCDRNSTNTCNIYTLGAVLAMLAMHCFTSVIAPVAVQVNPKRLPYTAMAHFRNNTTGIVCEIRVTKTGVQLKVYTHFKVCWCLFSLHALVPE